ncbi:tub, partial [Drosophila busckii]
NGHGRSIVRASSAPDPKYSKYNRCTELRRVDDNDIYKLAKILDVNSCWRKLMSIIPKRLDAQACSAAGALNYQEISTNVGLKYTAQEISLIDAERLSAGQSISQVMIDEWKTSGKQNERPTVGVLLQLLVHSEIYSAADFVATHFLNEPKPDRPVDGPAAHISLDLCSGDLSEDMEVDEGASFQPNTSALNAAAAQGRGTGMNLDYFDKHMVRRDKSVPQQLENGASSSVPVAPPRVLKISRQQRNTDSNAVPTTKTTTNTVSSASITPNMPNLSILNARSEELAPANEQVQQQLQNIPNVSILNGISEPLSSVATTSISLDAVQHDSSSNGSSMASTSTTVPNVPLITLLIKNTNSVISNTSEATTATASTTKSSTIPEKSALSYNNFPKISALNLNTRSDSIAAVEEVNGVASHYDNGGGDNHSSGTNSLSNNDDNDDDDDDDNDEANFDHPNSNNDSSLTTVTGTSGDNSFELTNDSSSTSNDDYTHNIPNLSELQE